MSGPIVVGAPAGVGVDVVRALSDSMGGGTLVWSDADALREASDAVAACDWDVLVVRPDDEGFSTAAMSHRAQVHGEPPVLVLAASRSDGDEVVAIGAMVARHLDVLPVIVIGDALDSWRPIAVELELAEAISTNVERVADVLADLVDIESVNRRRNG